MINLVTVIPLVPNHQLVLRVGSLHKRFQPTMVLHAVRETIAYQDQMIALLELHLSKATRQGGETSEDNRGEITKETALHDESGVSFGESQWNLRG